MRKIRNRNKKPEPAATKGLTSRPLSGESEGSGSFWRAKRREREGREKRMEC